MQVIGSSNFVQNIGSSSVSEVASLTDDDEFSFYDVLDIINPLQHIPIVSNLYQAMSGDTIGSIANVAGSTLFGGPVGGAIAFASEVADSIFGNDEPAQLKPDLSATQDVAAAKTANNAYEKMRVTTEDWLNPNFNSFA